MTSAYIASLNRALETVASPDAAPSLRQRLLDWFAALPDITRNRPFAMAELERALSTQCKYLSPVLLELGWRRGRKWSSQGQYNRFWVPPGLLIRRLGNDDLSTSRSVDSISDRDGRI
jgi:hypothetical protein